MGAPRFTYFAPALFCAILSAMQLVGGIVFSDGGSNPASGTFFCFLPMCFYFVGMALKKQHDRITALENELSARAQPR